MSIIPSSSHVKFLICFQIILLSIPLIAGSNYTCTGSACGNIFLLDDSDVLNVLNVPVGSPCCIYLEFQESVDEPTPLMPLPPAVSFLGGQLSILASFLSNIPYNQSISFGSSTNSYDLLIQMIPSLYLGFSQSSWFFPYIASPGQTVTVVISGNSCLFDMGCSSLGNNVYNDYRTLIQLTLESNQGWGPNMSPLLLALEAICVYPPDSNTDYFADITLYDGINKPVTYQQTNLTLYMKAIPLPKIDFECLKSSTNQITIKTGESFSINLPSTCFNSLENYPPFTLTLGMYDEEGGLNINVYPDWLDFRVSGTSALLTGTAPDQIDNNQVPLILLISYSNPNGANEEEFQFVINIEISFVFTYQILAAYGGAFITAIGFFVYLGPIYNIFFKQKYTYPLTFIIESGQTLDVTTVHPVIFAQEAIIDCKLMIKAIDNWIKKEQKVNSEEKTANLFDESYLKRDRPNIRQIIELLAAEMKRENNVNKRFFSEDYTYKSLVEQLVINHYTIRKLDTLKQSSAKKIFDDLKDRVLTLGVYQVDSGITQGGFTVDKSKILSIIESGDLNLKLIGKNSKSNKTNSKANLSPTEKPHLSNNLLVETNKSDIVNLNNIDMGLLTSALEAQAFNRLVLDSNIADVNIIIKTQNKKSSCFRPIARFLKLDLDILGSVGQALKIYGLKCQPKEDTIKFTGTANYKIQSTTLVVQITTRKGFIVRELWFQGAETMFQKEPCALESPLKL